MRKQQPTCIPCMGAWHSDVHQRMMPGYINASIKQPALFLARGQNSHALSSRTAVQSSPLAPFAAPVLCTTRPAVVRRNVVLCLCDPMSAGPPRGSPLLVLYACAVHGVCVLTGLPARQEVVRDPTSSAIMTHHGL